LIFPDLRLIHFQRTNAPHTFCSSSIRLSRFATISPKGFRAEQPLLLHLQGETDVFFFFSTKSREE
jgi:hypothetical protein